MTETAQPYCSDISIETGEPLAGSATPTEVYLLLEYNGEWGEKAVEESEIPADLKKTLTGYTKSNPLAKTLLIRSTRSLIQPGIRFFVARSAPDGAAMYDFHVAGYEDLLDLDISAMISGDPAYARYRRTQPLYLVCTNGRRDRCCARYGVEVFNALSEAMRQDANFSVWQCSHIGGHRFAANLIALPAGLLYGRVRPGEAAGIVSAGREGLIYLPNLRGRSAYPQPAQAAEVALRRKLDDLRLEAIRLVEMQPQGVEEWLATFERDGGERYSVRVQARDAGRHAFESCQMDKPVAVKEYSFQIGEDKR